MSEDETEVLGDHARIFRGIKRALDKGEISEKQAELFKEIVEPTPDPHFEQLLIAMSETATPVGRPPDPEVKRVADEMVSKCSAELKAVLNKYPGVNISTSDLDCGRYVRVYVEAFKSGRFETMSCRIIKSEETRFHYENKDSK